MTEAKPAKPAKDTIYIDVEDDITSIIGKTEAAQNKVVALVLPKRSAALHSIVNMRLLKRSAEEAGKNIALITSESSLLPLAGAAGIHVAKNLHSVPAIPVAPVAVNAAEPKTAPVELEAEEPAAKIDYQKPVGELAAAGDEDETEAIPLEDKAAQPAAPPRTKQAGKHGSKIKIPNFDRFRKLFGLGGISLLALIILLIAAAKILPKATITLKTSSTPISGSIDLTTSDKATKLDLKTNTIPAVLKTTEQTTTQQVTATGKKNLGKKASGSITMSAEKCAPNLTPKPASVPAGSAVTHNGLTYITQADTVFSNSGSVSSPSCVSYPANSATPIEAQSGGSNYNVDSVEFSVAGRSDVTGSGSASGGSDNNVTVLSQADVDAARKKVTANNNSESVNELKAGLEKDGFYILQDTLKSKTPAVTAAPAVGQQTSSSTVTIKIVHSVLVVKKADLEKAVTSALEKEIDTSKQKISDQDALKDADITVENQRSATIVNLSVVKRSTAVPIIDVEAIKRQAGGKERGAIQSELGTIPGVLDVSVKMSPFWVSAAPKNPSKVFVIQEEVESKINQEEQSGQPTTEPAP